MRTVLLFSLTFLLLGGCASLSEVDRSLVSSPLLTFEESDQDKLAPHSGLRGGATAGGGACSVCAH